MVDGEVIEVTGSSMVVAAALAANNAIRQGRADPRKLRAATGDVGAGVATAIALEALLT